MRGGSRDRAVEVPRGGASSAVTYGIRACPRPCSSVWIERLPSKQRVAGSSPAGGATKVLVRGGILSESFSHSNRRATNVPQRVTTRRHWGGRHGTEAEGAANCRGDPAAPVWPLPSASA